MFFVCCKSIQAWIANSRSVWDIYVELVLPLGEVVQRQCFRTRIGEIQAL